MQHDSTELPSHDRRRFLMLMGLACATTALAHPAVGFAEQTPAPPPAATPATTPAAPATTPVAPAPPDAAKPPSAEAVALAQLVQLRYPNALNAEQLKSLTEDLDSRLESGRALRKLSFANGDEPDMTFHA